MGAASPLGKEVTMQLLRIVFAGALLFGVGCELPEEGDLATEPRVDPTDLDDSTDYASAELDDEIDALDYAIDDTMALSSDISEAMMDEAESTDVLAEDEADVLGGGGKKKWKCCYCWEEDDNHDNGRGKDECYCAKHKKKDKAKKNAKNKCEDEHEDGCEFKECKKSH
jgi:hypothetical protein